MHDRCQEIYRLFDLRRQYAQAVVQFEEQKYKKYSEFIKFEKRINHEFILLTLERERFQKGLHDISCNMESLEHNKRQAEMKYEVIKLSKPLFWWGHRCFRTAIFRKYKEEIQMYNKQMDALMAEKEELVRRKEQFEELLEKNSYDFELNKQQFERANLLLEEWEMDALMAEKEELVRRKEQFEELLEKNSYDFELNKQQFERANLLLEEWEMAQKEQLDGLKEELTYLEKLNFREESSPLDISLLYDKSQKTNP